MRDGSARRMSPNCRPAIASTKSHHAPETIISSNIGSAAIVRYTRTAADPSARRRRNAPRETRRPATESGRPAAIRSLDESGCAVNDSLPDRLLFRRRDAAIRHRRLHVGLHLRRFDRIRGLFERARTSTMSGCVIGAAECYLSAVYSARSRPTDRRAFSPGGFVHARIDGDWVGSGPGSGCEGSDH